MIQYDDTTNESQEYQDFIEKFKPKKTTDDCYTQANIYEAVKAWAVNEYGLEGRPVLRPFYPGGDYIAEDYPPEAVVIDNPPFSILSQICEYYDMIGVDYFLFAPSLTLFSTYHGSANYIVADTDITYENGACVRTGFITNLGLYKVHVAPELRKVVRAEETKNTGKIPPAKYELPPEIITSAKLQRLAHYDIELKILADDVVFVRSIDSMRAAGKALYGAGFLLSEKATETRLEAERLATERASVSDSIVWELSERERELTRR